MKFPFDELNMRDATHVEWVKSQRDPELWHAAATAIVNTLGDPRGFLVWLADQPETDRATAGYVFLGTDGVGYLRGRREWAGEGLTEREWLNAMDAFCRRGSRSGFTNDSLGLDPGFEPARRECLEVATRGEVTGDTPIPEAIIGAPFPPEKTLRYFVEDGAVLDYNPGPFNRS
jgi:hypothetical protein